MEHKDRHKTLVITQRCNHQIAPQPPMSTTPITPDPKPLNPNSAKHDPEDIASKIASNSDPEGKEKPPDT